MVKIEMKKWILATSRKRVDFIWTYSGWINYISCMVALIAVLVLTTPLQFHLWPYLTLWILALMLPLDILMVYLFDRRGDHRNGSR